MKLNCRLIRVHDIQNKIKVIPKFQELIGVSRSVKTRNLMKKVVLVVIITNLSLIHI